MTKYEQTLEYMYAQLPMYQREGASAFKKDLTNIYKLSNYLGNPHTKLRTIHVAGTNGKGTVSHLTAYGLQVQGYKVGLYTSPHYMDFRERIKVDGQLIPKRNVVNFVSKHRGAIQEIKPSFFEITVAMAFDYFNEMQVDYAVIEVGLGGRLDSTNIITPLLSVITNISFDHMDMLGDTLELIAGEKAGIIKPNVPVVIGESQQEISHVFVNKAASCNSPISWADQEVTVNVSSDEVRYLYNGLQVKLPDILHGPFQHKNMVTAIAALLKLSLLMPIDWVKIEEKFTYFREMVNYMGRWQILQEAPMVIVDSAHNEAGIAYLEDLFKDRTDGSNLRIVCGFSKEKEINKILHKFPSHATYYFCKANIPRGLDAKVLSEQANRLGRKGKYYSSVSRAHEAALKCASKGDLVFVGGSIFVVAEVLKKYLT